MINALHSANLTLRRVTSIHKIQKIDIKQLKTQKQDGNCQKNQGSRQKEIEMFCKTEVKKEVL